MLKIFIPTDSKFYASWLKYYYQVEFVESVKKANLILFSGGEDVDPTVYGDERHRLTWSNRKRDELEIEVYREALKLGIPMIGICRGAQLITALQPGGHLIQDVEGHTWMHDATFKVGEDLVTHAVTSTHHQMMYPFAIQKEYEILGWASERMSGYYQGGISKLRNVPLEPEVVFYKEPKALAVQFHPEMMSVKSPVIEILVKFLNEKLGIK